MKLDTRCVVCNRFDEDGAHLFLKCKFWSHLGLSRVREMLLSKTSARDVLEAVMNLKEEPRLKCCYALWMCWSGRNKIRDGEAGRDAVWLSHSIYAHMAEWKK